MRFATLSLLLASCSFAADAKEDEAKAELEKMQGTWQLVSAETDGKASSGEVIKTIRVVISGSKHTVFIGDDVAAKDIPFALDASTKPKTVTDKLRDNTEIKGIYELEGDTLRSCVAPAGKDRPTEFSSKNGNTLRVFKKVKS